MALAAEAFGEPRPLSRAEHQEAEGNRDRAVSLMREKQFGEAVPLFREVAPVFRDDAWFNHDYGAALVNAGGRDNITLGIILIDLAIMLHEEEAEPNDWMHVGRAEALARARRYDEAREEYEVVQGINAENE